MFELGCGEAGVLGAFARAGASHAVGVDISAYRINVGRQIAQTCGLPVTLDVRNILEEPIPTQWQAAFDLVILRDVIEHLDDTCAALGVVKQLLRAGGAALVTFPPYYSPFGGHQHLLGTPTGMIPWVHLAPSPVFEWVISQSKRPADQEEVRRLRHIRLTPRVFESAVASVGLQCERCELYLLRPVFRYKFGLPSVKFPGWLRRTLLAEFLATEALYLLRVA